jgi:quinohemoprotein ethanol dehydrogenase
MVWYYQEVPGDDWDYDSIADLMLADLTINGRQRKVIMHAPKDAFFYVIDRVTGEVISADPITKVSWATGIDAKGHAMVNPGARYKTTPVTVNPGPSGGHVWPPWSYNPGTGLVYIPGTAGQSSNYTAAASFTPAPTEIGPTGRGQMNMGTALGGGQLGRGANQAKGAPPPDNAEAAAVQAAQEAAAKQAAAPKPEPLAQIGPDGVTGNVLYAWDPIARKERWRAAGAGAGPFAGGSLSTAGNLVFSSVNNKLLVFRADTGEKLLDLDLHTSQLGPPISFTIDGKQYISVAGGPPGGTAFGGGGAGPAHLLVLALDGTAPIPGTPAN